MISRMCDLLRGKPGPDSGAYYENKAWRYLARRGVKTLACNYHCRFGEIDLIAMDKQTLLFVEVRYRTAALYGSAVASVTGKNPPDRQTLLAKTQTWQQNAVPV
jgi:putative endonuclease